MPLPPLAGLAVSVKDLFDVQGVTSSAGSRVLADAAPAATDCPAVARLRRAGAALTGHTNMSEFAFSGVGINPHHGTPANAATARLDKVARIPGGSTSGGAVTVAGSAAWAALGSDTGGSIRIPAALQGLVGFKNTARLTPTEGSVPLSTTLDTACAITRSVRDAVLLHEVLAERSVRLARRPLAQRALAVVRRPCSTPWTRRWPAPSRRRWRRCARPARRSTRSPTCPLPNFAALNASAASRRPRAWAWHRGRLAEREADYDPRVVRRIRRGASMSAADYIEMLALRESWIAEVERRLAAYDAMLARPCRSWRRPSNRWWRATRTSSPPTRCCCATLRSSICSTAAR